MIFSTLSSIVLKCFQIRDYCMILYYNGKGKRERGSVGDMEEKKYAHHPRCVDVLV